MLSDELKRCQEMLDSLEKSVSELPRGVINERKNDTRTRYIPIPT